jgi:WhiB family redox-sensing transcriptional regulator
MSDISQHWTDDAACKNHNPDLWFPVELFTSKNKRLTNQVIDAIEICLPCPVRTQCFDYARASNQKHGIWGGRIFTPVKM